MCHPRRTFTPLPLDLRLAQAKHGGARWDQALVQPEGGLFPVRRKRQKMAPMTRGDKKSATAETITPINAGQFACHDAQRIQQSQWSWSHGAEGSLPDRAPQSWIPSETAWPAIG